MMKWQDGGDDLSSTFARMLSRCLKPFSSSFSAINWSVESFIFYGEVKIGSQPTLFWVLIVYTG